MDGFVGVVLLGILMLWLSSQIIERLDMIIRLNGGEPPENSDPFGFRKSSGRKADDAQNADK